MNSSTEDATTDWIIDNVSRNVPSFSLPAAKLGIITGSITGTVGTCANSVVLVVLLYARRHFGSNVNTLLTNQTLMDLCSSVLLVVGMATYAERQKNRSLAADNDVVCFLFLSRLMPHLCKNASKIGLVVITLERYVKVVHAVAHRKHYRSWMTAVGVAVPWISGLLMYLTPAFFTVRQRPGQCLQIYIAWPSKVGRMVHSMFEFVWQYCMPVGIFAYCYARIFHTIRRQSKVLGFHESANTVAKPTTSRGDQDTGQIQQQATGTAATSAKLSRTELNIIKIMVTVIIAFIICWTPTSINHAYQAIVGTRSMPDVSALMGTFAFINIGINPLIYAARYDVFKKALNKMLKKTENTATTRGT